MKIANIRLSWVRSASTDVSSRKLTVAVDGNKTVFDIPAEVSEYVLDVPARVAVTFFTQVFDSEGNVAQSETYAFTLGDLEAPQPDTSLFHEILSVRDDSNATSD